MSIIAVPTRSGVAAVPAPYGTGASGAPGAPGGNVMAVGLFIALAAMSVPTGTAIIQTAGHTTSGKGYATYIEDTTLDDAAVAAFPDVRVKTSNGRYFRLSHEQMLNPHMFGAVDSNDGTLRDTGPALAAMDDYLHSIAINPSTPGGNYRGAPPIFWGNNHFHDEATPLEPKSTIIWWGAGSGRWGASGGAGTFLTFGHNCPGPRPQAFNTTGITGVVADHDASASFVAKHMRWSGGYNGTGVADEAEIHGFNPRGPYMLEDVFIENFQGTGFLAEAGNVTRLGTNIGGNVSTSRAVSVKVANCRDGFIVGGGDGNLMSFPNCEAYQNRRYGVRNENGAGATLFTQIHTASNGMIGGIGSYTQCSNGGYRYALAEGGNPLNAPSGTTADTADWLFIEAGGVVANLIPAWVATPGLFRAGGDLVDLLGARFLECYSEYGGFNKFASTTVVDGGTIGDQYFRGGQRFNARSDGYRLTQLTTCAVTLKHHGGGESAILAVDEAEVEHAGIHFVKTFGNQYMARDASGHLFYTAPYGGANTLRVTLSQFGIELPTGHAVYINGNQVVAARRTGWGAPTGTATRTTFDTTTVTLPQLAERLKALIDDLTAIGPIGP